MSFKRIFYDYRQNKIYHWFIDEDGKTKREEFHPKRNIMLQIILKISNKRHLW